MVPQRGFFIPIQLGPDNLIMEQGCPFCFQYFYLADIDIHLTRCIFNPDNKIQHRISPTLSSELNNQYSNNNPNNNNTSQQIQNEFTNLQSDTEDDQEFTIEDNFTTEQCCQTNNDDIKPVVVNFCAMEDSFDSARPLSPPINRFCTVIPDSSDSQDSVTIATPSLENVYKSNEKELPLDSEQCTQIQESTEIIRSLSSSGSFSVQSLDDCVLISDTNPSTLQETDEISIDVKSEPDIEQSTLPPSTTNQIPLDSPLLRMPASVCAQSLVESNLNSYTQPSTIQEATNEILNNLKSEANLDQSTSPPSNTNTIPLNPPLNSQLCHMPSGRDTNGISVKSPVKHSPINPISVENSLSKPPNRSLDTISKKPLIESPRKHVNMRAKIYSSRPLSSSSSSSAKKSYSRSPKRYVKSPSRSVLFPKSTSSRHTKIFRNPRSRSPEISSNRYFSRSPKIYSDKSLGRSPKRIRSRSPKIYSNGSLSRSPKRLRISLSRSPMRLISRSPKKSFARSRSRSSSSKMSSTRSHSRSSRISSRKSLIRSPERLKNDSPKQTTTSYSKTPLRISRKKYYRSLPSRSSSRSSWTSDSRPRLRFYSRSPSRGKSYSKSPNRGTCYSKSPSRRKSYSRSSRDSYSSFDSASLTTPWTSHSSSRSLSDSEPGKKSSNYQSAHQGSSFNLYWPTKGQIKNSYSEDSTGTKSYSYCDSNQDSSRSNNLNKSFQDNYYSTKDGTFFKYPYPHDSKLRNFDIKPTGNYLSSDSGGVNSSSIPAKVCYPSPYQSVLPNFSSLTHSYFDSDIPKISTSVQIPNPFRPFVQCLNNTSQPSNATISGVRNTKSASTFQRSLPLADKPNRPILPKPTTESTSSPSFNPQIPKLFKLESPVTVAINYAKNAERKNNSVHIPIAREKEHPIENTQSQKKFGEIIEKKPIIKHSPKDLESEKPFENISQLKVQHHPIIPPPVFNLLQFGDNLYQLEPPFFVKANNKFVCQICLIQYTKATYSTHLMSHVNLQCILCKDSLSPFVLISHLATDHLRIEGPQEMCPVCSDKKPNTTGSVQRMTRHILTLHYRLNCPVCACGVGLFNFSNHVMKCITGLESILLRKESNTTSIHHKIAQSYQ